MIHTAEIKRGDDVLDTIHVLDTPMTDVIICQEASHFFAGFTALPWEEYIEKIDGVIVTVDGEFFGDAGPFFVAKEQYEDFKKKIR